MAFRCFVQCSLKTVSMLAKMVKISVKHLHGNMLMETVSLWLLNFFREHGDPGSGGGV